MMMACACVRMKKGRTSRSLALLRSSNRRHRRFPRQVTFVLDGAVVGDAIPLRAPDGGALSPRALRSLRPVACLGQRHVLFLHARRAVGGGGRARARWAAALIHIKNER